MCSIKWLVGIHVLDHEFQGFYQKERYMSVNGPGAETYYTYHTKMKVKSIITNPVPGEIIPPDGYVLAGAAWSGEAEVVRVEISADGGKTWQLADIVRPRRGLLLVPVGVQLETRRPRYLYPHDSGHQQPGRDPAGGIPRQVGRARLR